MASMILGSPPVDQPGFDLYADQGGKIIGTSVALMIVASVFVALRLTSRWVARAGYWWDDILIVVALLLSLAPSICNIYSVNHSSFGKHIWAVQQSPQVAMTQTFKTLYVFQIFFDLATSTTKLCTLLFYLRIFPLPQLRLILSLIILLVTCFLLASTGISIFQCTPIHKFWHVSQPGSCLPVRNNLVITGSINIALDFLVVLFPVPLLWRLHTSTKQKLLLTGIFLLAGFVCIVSIIRIVWYTSLNPMDITWNVVSCNLWSATEPCAGIACACIPSLRPLLASVTDRLSSSARSWGRLASGRSESARASRISVPGGFFEGQEMGVATRGVSTWGRNTRAYRGDEENEKAVVTEEVEVPQGVIRVQTDMRISVCDRWEYKDRVF